MIKKLFTLHLILLFTIGISCSDEKTVNQEETPKEETKSYPGLSVSASGELQLNGKPFQGIGVNYFNAFIRTLDEGQTNNQTYIKGLDYLKERKIPFIRFAINGYWPKNWDLYRNNKEAYFKNLDAFVKAAEDRGIGLIPSFFWHTPTVPDLVGEPVNQWGNANSKTHAFMNKFIEEVVLRYRESPAIWGWEQGNEVNLLVDLPGDDSNLPAIVPSLGTPTTRSKADKLSTNDLLVMMKAFGNTVRKYDSSRIIISGNAIARASAYHLHQQKNWTKDSKAQFQEMLSLQNPNPINVLSSHIYKASSTEGYFADGETDIDGMIASSMEVAKNKKKPFFLGEWGAQQNKYGDDTKNIYLEILQAIEKNKVPISAMWVFDYPPHDTEEGINVSPDNGPREYMLTEIMKVNARMNP